MIRSARRIVGNWAPEDEAAYAEGAKNGPPGAHEEIIGGLIGCLVPVLMLTAALICLAAIRFLEG